MLIAPQSDSTHTIAGIEDPSVVYYNGKYHVFASVANSSVYNLVYLSFTDWSQAGSATQYYLDRSPIGTGYRAAPEVFYFAPQNLWYLVYQTGNASYSTNPDISNPGGWSAVKTFYSSVPSNIQTDIRNGANWLDFAVACDTVNCHLFSAGDNGKIYRSQTTLANFPNGFGSTVVTLMPSAASSACRPSDSAVAANFAASYGRRCGAGTRPPIEVTLTMRPPGRRRIRGSAARVSRSGA